MFRRRVFYDTAGKVIRSYVMHGSFNPHYTIDQEKNDLNITGCACLEWTTPDEEIEAAFASTDFEDNPRNVNIRVDLSGPEPQVIFSYTSVTEPTQTDDTADMQAALNLLGVVPEEETT